MSRGKRLIEAQRCAVGLRRPTSHIRPRDPALRQVKLEIGRAHGPVGASSERHGGFAPLTGGAPTPSPIAVRLVTRHETAVVCLRDGGLAAAQEPDPLWTVELCGHSHASEAVLAGTRTLGQSFYAGVIAAPAVEPKHNLVVALAWSIRPHQDPRRPKR